MKAYKDVGATIKLSVPAAALHAIGVTHKFDGVEICWDNDVITIRKMTCPDCDSFMVGCKSGGVVCPGCGKHCE